MNNDKRVCLGAIAGAHGVKGDVRLKSFAEHPDDIASYGPLQSEDGQMTFTIQRLKPLKDTFFSARITEITNRDDAVRMKGQRLYLSRDLLPEPHEDEFYYDDLVGLAVEYVDGQPAGLVKAVFNHGAGDLIEIWKIPDIKGSRLLPFTKACVPTVDLKNGRVVIDPPIGSFDEAGPEKDHQEAERESESDGDEQT